MKTIYQKSIFWCACPRSPSNERIVRMAGKMAQAFCGSLTALYVQTPGYSGMNAGRYRSTAGEYTSCTAAWCRDHHNTWRRCTNADCGICATLRCDQNRNWAQRRAATAFLERTDADRTAHYACARKWTFTSFRMRRSIKAIPGNHFPPFARRFQPPGNCF